MPQFVNVAGHGTVGFPDEMSQGQIHAALLQNFPPPAQYAGKPLGYEPDTGIAIDAPKPIEDLLRSFTAENPVGLQAMGGRIVDALDRPLAPIREAIGRGAESLAGQSTDPTGRVSARVLGQLGQGLLTGENAGMAATLPFAPASALPPLLAKFSTDALVGPMGTPLGDAGAAGAVKQLLAGGSSADQEGAIANLIASLGTAALPLAPLPHAMRAAEETGRAPYSPVQFDVDPRRFAPEQLGEPLRGSAQGPTMPSPEGAITSAESAVLPDALAKAIRERFDTEQAAQKAESRDLAAEQARGFEKEAAGLDAQANALARNLQPGQESELLALLAQIAEKQKTADRVREQYGAKPVDVRDQIAAPPENRVGTMPDVAAGVKPGAETVMPGPETAPAPAERRVNLAERKRIDDMSHEEAIRALKVDPVTGLPSSRAWTDRETHGDFEGQHVLKLDLDGFKWVNDTFGHEAGDAAAALVGDAARQVGLGDVLHRHSPSGGGDEFIGAFRTPAEAEAAAARLRTALDHQVLRADMPGGGKEYWTGLDFSHGIGPDAKAAEVELGSSKADRSAVGLRSSERGGKSPLLQRVGTEPAAGNENLGGAARTSEGAPVSSGPVSEGHAGRTAGSVQTAVEEPPAPAEALPTEPTHTHETIGQYRKTAALPALETTPRSWEETKSAVKGKESELLARAMKAKPGEMLSNEVREAAGQRLKALAEAGRPEDIAELDHLSNVLYGASSEAGRSLNYSKSMIGEDITDAAAVVDAGMKATKGELSVQAKRDLADMARKAKTSKQQIDASLAARAEAALTRLEEGAVKKLTVKDVLACR